MVVRSRMRWSEREARICTYEMSINICTENFKGRDYLGDRGVDGRIILTWVLK